MKKLILKEARAPYNISLDDALLTDEVVLLEKDGQPVAALVSMDEYAAFQRMLPELLKEYEGVFKG